MLDLFFETSWEVCNKVGGIYAVLSTKAKTLQSEYKDKVVFIGPDLSDDNPFFVCTNTVLDSWREQAKFPPGMTVKTGRWNVPGKPLAVLVNYNSLYVYKNQLFAQMWREFGVDSLHAYGDYDESCVFSYGAALVIESLVAFKKAKRVIAHFDEWTTCTQLLKQVANKLKLKLAKLFSLKSLKQMLATNTHSIKSYLYLAMILKLEHHMLKVQL